MLLFELSVPNVRLDSELFRAPKFQPSRKIFVSWKPLT